MQVIKKHHGVTHFQLTPEEVIQKIKELNLGQASLHQVSGPNWCDIYWTPGTCRRPMSIRKR